MNTEYDVAILGSGFSGCILGAILSRNGLKVGIFDRGSHPRFTIGESTIPQTTAMLNVMAERFDVPELKNISALSHVVKNVNQSCGIKQIFGFVYHQKNKPLHPKESNQTFTFQDELHYFRQDIDQYLVNVAISYGCTIHHNTNTESVKIEKEGTILTTSKGDFKARYIADGSGYNSVLANMFNLRENPTRCKTHSRGIFTHMIDVPPFDHCIPPGIDHGMPVPWNQGTLHHIFDGGWMWVIPFDNHAKSTNPLCSVGLMLDPRKYPKSETLTPEQEFYHFLEDYPSIGAQFKTAKSVRDWVGSGRINYSSTKSVGDRFCLLSHACGFIDPLYSRGLCSTVETLNTLAGMLLEACEDDDFSEERFSSLDTFQQGLVDFNDRLVNCSFISFKSFNLWNAWYRLWFTMSIYGRFRVARTYYKYAETSDKKYMNDLPNTKFPGATTNNPKLIDFFDHCAKLMEGFEAGSVTEKDAIDGLYKAIEKSEFTKFPIQVLHDPESRNTISSPVRFEQFKNWAQTWAAKEIRDEYFDFNLDLIKALE